MTKRTLLIFGFFALIVSAFGRAPPNGGGGSTGGGGSNPTNPNDPTNYAITYESTGVDTARSYAYQGGQVTQINSIVQWGSGPALLGAFNNTNTSQSPLMTSNGTYVIHVTWIGSPSAVPAKVGLAITSNATYGAQNGGCSGALANGIGSPTIPTEAGAYTPETRLRVVALSGGTGTLTLQKHAEGTITGAMTSVYASAKGILAQIDNRFVSIVTINGGWPTIPADTQEIPVTYYTSDGIPHNMSYMGKSVVPSPLIYNGDFTDYSKWEIGLPMATQTIEHFALGNTVTTPQELSPQSVVLAGAVGFGILGQQTPNSYSWNGSGRFTDQRSGSLPINGVWEIPSQEMTIYPDALIKDMIYSAEGLISGTTACYTLMRGEDAAYKLDFVFHDGVTAQSKRDVTYHCAVEPEHVGAYFDKNVDAGFIPAPLQPAPENDPFKVPGYATRGHETWPALIYKPDDKVSYLDDGLSLVASKYVGLFAEIGAEALGTAFTVAVKHLISFINAQYPPPIIYDVPRDQWNSPGNFYDISGSENWYYELTGDPNPHQ